MDTAKTTVNGQGRARVQVVARVGDDVDYQPRGYSQPMLCMVEGIGRGRLSLIELRRATLTGQPIRRQSVRETSSHFVALWRDGQSVQK